MWCANVIEKRGADWRARVLRRDRRILPDVDEVGDTNALCVGDLVLRELVDEGVAFDEKAPWGVATHSPASAR